MAKCLNLDCNNSTKNGRKYCCDACKKKFPCGCVRANHVLEAKTLEEFHRRFYVIYQLFKNAELLKVFGISHNTLRKIYVNVYSYTDRKSIEEYWMEYKERRNIKDEKRDIFRRDTKAKRGAE